MSSEFIALAEKLAKEERIWVETIRTALLEEAENHWGLELIEHVAQLTSIDASTVQGEYWCLLKCGKLKLPE